MKKIITFGEVMLRLQSPGRTRLLQEPLLEATFGGGEANVAVSLAHYGHQTELVSAVPDNPIGQACIRELAQHGVGTRYVRVQPGRLGIYFLEAGSSLRASQVIYDRAGSCFSALAPGDVRWKDVFADADWFHLTGITPALSPATRDATLEALKEARSAGVRVSLDLNYRAKLWKYGQRADDVMPQLAKHVDVLIGNEEDVQQSLGIECKVDVSSGSLGEVAYSELTDRVLTEYPDVNLVALTLRESHSADHNGWSACLRDQDGFRRSRVYDLRPIVDRVGAGDSFAGGLIHGLVSGMSSADALAFAVAASALKHTIPGDFNRVTVNEVQRVVGGDSSGRVQR